MANNYTVTGNQTNPLTGELINLYQQDELIGDVVIAGNIANWSPDGVNDSTILTITPNSSYVIAAANFSVNNMSSLVGRVSEVTFSDVTTAWATDNTVKVLVSLEPTFQLDGTSANDNISLDIDGDASLVTEQSPPIDLALPIFEITETIVPGQNTNNNANATPNITIRGDGLTADVTETGDITQTIIRGQVANNEPIILAALSMPADDGYFFPTQPSLMPVGVEENVLRIVPSGITRDSQNRITTYNFNMVYKNNVSIKSGSGARVFLKWKTTKIPTATTEIKDVKYGASEILNNGETRPITIYGDVGAEFDITITKDLDGSSIIDRSLSNTQVVDTIGGLVNGINKTLKLSGRRSGIASYTFNQEFPVNSGFTTTVDGTRDSATMVINGDTGFVTKNNNIRKGDQLIYNDVDTGAIVTVSSITDATTVVLSEAVDMDDNDSIRFVRPESYHINIYPKGSTTLKSNIPTVVPHYTLYQYRNPTLILKTSETDGSYTGPTNVYQHTGRPNARPSTLKRLKQTPSTFSVKWICTGHTFSAVATSGIPIWSSTDSTTSHWSNSVYADNGGTHIEIFNIAVTGIGTTTFTLTADVLIKKWGTQDVTMNLDLDQIIT
tara:strand:- start:88 stop:1926 length:1839 start_codon:yes stop_codon:yes gene_type:complete